MGWLGLIGLITVFIFGVLHIDFMTGIREQYEDLNSRGRKIAWTGVLLYPLIFLFQFDFGDTAGNFYVYEILTGDKDSIFENYAYYLAIIAAFIYLINYFLWKIKRVKN